MKFYTKILDNKTPAEIKDYLDPSFARTLGYHGEAPVEAPDVPAEAPVEVSAEEVLVETPEDVPDFNDLMKQPETRMNTAWLSQAAKGEIDGIGSDAQIEAIKLRDSFDAAHKAQDGAKMQQVLKEVEEFMDKNSTVSKSYTRIRTEGSGGSSDVVMDK